VVCKISKNSDKGSNKGAKALKRDKVASKLGSRIKKQHGKLKQKQKLKSSTNKPLQVSPSEAIKI